MNSSVATTTRICSQHGATLFYHRRAGFEPVNENHRGRKTNEIAKDWRCLACDRCGQLPTWVESAREGWAGVARL